MERRGKREVRKRGKGRGKKEERGRVSRIIVYKQQCMYPPHKVSKMIAITHWYRLSSYLGCNLLLELVNLMGHDLQFAFHLGDLVPGLNQVLAAQVAITAHCLIECLSEIENEGERCRDKGS